jgi:hypothetical protein
MSLSVLNVRKTGLAKNSRRVGERANHGRSEGRFILGRRTNAILLEGSWASHDPRESSGAQRKGNVRRWKPLPSNG